MKKFVIIFMFIFLLLGQSFLLAGDFEESITVSGKEHLPQLFYEHNFFDTKTAEGEIAYCLEPNKTGSEESDYSVTIKDKSDLPIDENILIRILEKGYPNEIFPGFSEKESQTITSMAFRALAMEYLNLSKGRSAEEYVLTQYGDKKAKEACYNLIAYGKGSGYMASNTSALTLSATDNSSQASIIELDNSYYIAKEYKVEGDRRYQSINIEVSENAPAGINYPKIVENGASFLVYFPIKEGNKIGEFSIKATASSKNRTIVYLKSLDPNRQSYLSYSNPNIEQATQQSFSYEPQGSSLVIRKLDQDRGFPLADISFYVWLQDEYDKKEIYTTDEKGEILIEEIYDLGEYSIMEINSHPFYQPHIDIDKININQYNMDFEKIIYNNKIRTPELFIQKSSQNIVKPLEEMNYEISDIRNCGNIAIDGLTIEDNLPFEYFSLNKEITIDKFVESDCYEIFVTDEEGKIEKLVYKNIDTDDELEDSSFKNLTIENDSVYFSDKDYIINKDLNKVKEIDLVLVSDFSGQEFIIPDFKKGSYTLYSYTAKGKVLLAENIEGEGEYKVRVDEEISGFKVVFKEPIDIFKLNLPIHKAKADDSTSKYYIIADSNIRKDILLIDNLSANISNKIDISFLYKNNILKEEEEIVKVKIIFKDLVPAGFRLDGKIILKGQVKENIHKTNNNVFLNIVKIFGYSQEGYVENFDEWDSKIIEDSYLPKTGKNYLLVFGIGIAIMGVAVLSLAYLNKRRVNYS